LIHAFFFSALAHLLLVGGIFYFSTAPAPPSGITEVFVTEGASEKGKIFSRSQTAARKSQAPIHGGSRDDAPPTVGEQEGAAQVPVMESALAPPYPLLSRRLGEEGRVELILEMDAGGVVTKVSVTKSSGYSRLDEAARSALLDSRFAPTSTSMAGRTKKLSVEFRLKD